MPAKTGLTLPFQANGRRRLRVSGGNEQLRKIILLNLGDLESENPFQDDLGLGGDLIFAVNNEELRSDLKLRIDALFRRLLVEDRAKLRKEPTFEIFQEAQELVVNIEYINIEENRAEEIELNFSSVPDADASASLLSAL